ncbi:photosynthetic apparatus regulatory protein RegA [Mariprofundus micogutta]|uniref:Photosynthetic apparatus regulatory protein RegA n=1 Tax=Mariprofundus micogutta TaxID=1921010 RepID=A0A1L8CM42_9PROT|nr:response regulator transcription factor [Mariprofundus micogutta]GAV19988.1 photosynthetic apparatus regulatory protein RegA [Mariprofundus micogutta]
MSVGVENKILIVDDDEIIRIYLQHALEEHGYAVTPAADFGAVKDAMHHDQYALVLMDLVFVDCSYDGFDILDYVRSLSETCGIIIMTSYPDTDSAVQAIRIKASDYLTKPVKQNELIATVEKVLSETSLPADKTDTLANPGDYGLSSREMEVLKMLYKGYSYVEMSAALGCGTSTAKTYGKRVYKKLGVKSRSEAVYEALQLKLIKR